jgi:hypothetical protein
MEKGVAFTFRVDASARRVAIVYQWQPTAISQWHEAMEEIFKDPAYEHGFDFLLDRTKIEQASSTAFIKDLVAYIDRHWRTKGQSRWVFVTHDIAAFGTGRMGEQLTAFPGSLRIFKSMQEATNWLDGESGSSSSPPSGPSAKPVQRPMN